MMLRLSSRPSPGSSLLLIPPQYFLREFEAEYATHSFDSTIPPHTPLDCSSTKTRVTRQKSFSKPSTSLVPTPFTASLLPSRSPASSAPLASPSSPPLASPRLHQVQTTNIARELRQQGGKQSDTGAMVLGKEPDSSQGKPVSTSSRYLPLIFDPYFARFPFLRRVTDSLERSAKSPFSAPTYKCGVPLPPTPPTPRVFSSEPYYEDMKSQPYYEEIAVMKKRKQANLRPAAEDQYECVPSRPHTPAKTQTVPSTSGAPEPARPFDRFQESLFKTFTAVVPWWVMKRVYWRRLVGCW